MSMSTRASVRLAVASLSLSMLMPSLATSSANVSLPALAQAFTASFQAVQWVVLAYLLAVTPLVVGAGRLGDVIGRRRLLLAGIGVFTAASLLCGVAPTLWLLITARAAQGLGAAVMMALTMALVGETVPKERTGAAMGLLGTMSAIGTTLGPTIGGLLIAAFGWRAVFLVNVPVALVALVLAARHLPVDRHRSETDAAAFDRAGTLLMTLTLGAYALAMTLGRDRLGPLNVALLLAAALGSGIFALAESRAASPLIPLTMFRRPLLGASLAMNALVSAVMMATLVVGPFYLSGALGLGAALAGTVMSVGPLVAALTGVPGGRMADRFGASRMTIAGLVLMSAGCVSLSMMPSSGGIAGYVAPIAFVSGGYALFQAANNAVVIADVRPDQRGVVAGLLLLSRNLGLMTGAAILGAVFAHASEAAANASARSEAVAAGLRTTFAVAAMLIVAALAIARVGQGAVSPAPLAGAREGALVQD